MKRIRHFIGNILGDFPEMLFKLNYYRVNHIWLNTKNPSLFYDKIAYLAFHTDTTKWSELADKLGVRKYAQTKGYGNNFPKLYGVWKMAAEVDFASLPDRFVIKTNNSCNTNIIVKDKSKLNENQVRAKLDEWMHSRYGRETAQPHYSRIKPMIFAEEFLENKQCPGQPLTDYKFFCFNGSPFCVHVMKDRVENSHAVNVQFYDMQWQPHPEYISYDPMIEGPLAKPDSFEQMKKMVSDLSVGFPFVRIDMYEINGTPIIGEMTFTPGPESFSPIILSKFGQLMKIDNANQF